MSPRYPRLRSYSAESGAITSDAIVLCFYMKHPHQRLAGAVLRALELLRERILPSRLAWRIDDEGQYHELGEPGWDALRHEMLGPEKFMALRLEGPRQDASDFYVDYRGLPLPLPWPSRAQDTSVLHVRLPTEYLEERGPSHVRTLALDMAEELPFNTGYVTWGLCDTETSQDLGLLASASKRYLGLHLAGSGAKLSVGTAVDGIHWLNFLGQPVLGKLGGMASLRQQLAPLNVSLREMPGERVLLSLGEWPEVGDMEAGETLPRYHALARLLEPCLYHERGFHPLGAEELLRWERRLLGS